MGAGSGAYRRWPNAAADKSPFVGRERELALLGTLLQNVASHSSGRAVLVAGEPGIGKTRLLTEVAKGAADSGWLVLLGRAYESEGMPPYLPFTEALGSHIRGVADNRLASELGDRAAELSLILPEVARRLPDLPPLPPLDPGNERYRLFEGVCDYLAAVAGGRDRPGLVLGIEDLQWADESTLLLLEHLGRRLGGAPIVLLGSYRDTVLAVGQPLARTIEELSRITFCEQLTLRRLDRDALSLLLSGLSGTEPPARFADVVYRETEGNPLFVHEVYRYLSDEGRLFDGEGHWLSDLRIGEVEIPRGVQLVIGRRIGRVSEGCRRALTSAAIIGRVFDFDLLREVSEMAEAELLDATDEAERAQLVASGPDGSAALLTFTHELIRQALASGLSLPRRRALHVAVAEAIERRHAQDLDAHTAELTLHYSFGGEATQREKLVRYAMLAGRTATKQHAHPEAVGHFRTALAAKQDQQPDAEAAAILLDLGMALWALSRRDEFWPCLEQAFDYHVNAGDAVAAVGVAQQLGPAFFWPGFPRLAERASPWSNPAQSRKGGFSCLSVRSSASRATSGGRWRLSSVPRRLSQSAQTVVRNSHSVEREDSFTTSACGSGRHSMTSCGPSHLRAIWTSP